MRFRTRNLVLAAIALALLTGTVLHEAYKDPSAFDERAARHIRKLCGRRTDCQVSLYDLVRDDWITSPTFNKFYDFPPETSNEYITKIIGKPFSKPHDMQRVIIVIGDFGIESSEAADVGIEAPLANEVMLHCSPVTGPYTVCPSVSLFKVKAIDTAGDKARFFKHSGTAYVLTQFH